MEQPFSCLSKKDEIKGNIIPDKMIKQGYIARWNQYPEQEIKIRVAGSSILGPSQELLDNWKEGKITWEEYTKRFKREIRNNPQSVEKLKEIKELSREKDVRLICYEKNPPCHRFILIEMIKNLKQEVKQK